MTRPVFYLLAGPNGAGKSTLYKALKAAGKLPAEAEFVNADLYEAAHLQHIQDPVSRSEAARQWADARRVHLLAQAVRLADAAVLHDSFDAQPGAHKVVATCQGHSTRILHPALPQWAQTVLQLPH